MRAYPLLIVLLAALASAHAADETLRSTGKKGQKTALERPAEQSPRPGILGDIQLTQITLADAARMLSQVGKANVVVTGSIADKVVSLYLHDATVEDMVRNLCRAAGVWYRYDTSSKTYVIMSGSEYQKDLALVRDEQTKVFTLRHHNVVATANAVKGLFGSRVVLSIRSRRCPLRHWVVAIAPTLVVAKVAVVAVEIAQAAEQGIVAPAETMPTPAARVRVTPRAQEPIRAGARGLVTPWRITTRAAISEK